MTALAFARRHRGVLTLIVALASGIAIAWIDSRPTWDDTGLTAGLLVLAAAVAAFVSGRRPWLWILLVGAPIPLVEGVFGGNSGALLALAFAGFGAAVGYFASVAVRSERGAAT